MRRFLVIVVSLLLVAAGCEKATMRTPDGENDAARPTGDVDNEPAHAVGTPQLTTTLQIAAVPRVYDETSDFSTRAHELVIQKKLNGNVSVTVRNGKISVKI